MKNFTVSFLKIVDMAAASIPFALSDAVKRTFNKGKKIMLLGFSNLGYREYFRSTNMVICLIIIFFKTITRV
jgi:hypothetical protein